MMKLLRRGRTAVGAVRSRVLSVSPVRVTARPDFLVIGAQKAGTTSFYSMLTRHPDVLRARRKELHYFDKRVYSEDISRYWADFPSLARMGALERVRGRRLVTGEATPYYMFHPLVPDRVLRHVPDVKLIAILRDPVERAISHYWMEFNRKVEALPLEAALAAEPERLGPSLDLLARGERPHGEYQMMSYVARGRYAEQLERWLARFDRSRLLVLRFEDLVADPATVFATALEFLGVAPDVAAAPPLEARMVGERRETAPETLAWLREQFREPNERLAELTGIDYNTGSS